MSLVDLLLIPIPGGIAGNAAYDLLKHIAGHLIGAEDQLDKIVRAPFRTGVRLAEEALELPCSTPDEVAFREQHTLRAILDLEKASDLLNIDKKDARDRAVTLMMLSLCYALLPFNAGTLKVARARWNLARPMFELERADLLAKAASWDSDAAEERRAWLRAERVGYTGDFGFIQSDGSSEEEEASACRQRAERLSAIVNGCDTTMQFQRPEPS